MAKKLRLTALAYDQPEKLDDRDSPTTRRFQGEVFEVTSDKEYDRLIEQGAAEDPDAVNERKREALEAERARLDAEQAALEAQFGASADPGELKGKQLDAALEAAGLSKDGTADEKRARLAEHAAQAPS